MKIKRFVDSNMRRVLRQVRDDQGPEAVILSNRRVAEGIEVVAAIDYDKALIQQALQGPAVEDRPVEDNDEPERGEDTVADIHVVSTGLQPVDVENDTDDEGLVSLDALRSEISDMRGMIETQLSGLNWERRAQKDPARAQMLRNLTKIGIAPDVCNLITDRLGPIDEPRQLWRKPLHALAEALPVTGSPLLREGGVAALIGPTGVGKTTTIAKIATRFAMQHGTAGIALVSADAHRIGAQEQLATYAEILDVKVHLVEDSRTLERTLQSLRDKKLVLIDTEGCSQRDRQMTDRLAAYGNNSERVHYYLTLAATCQEAGLDETIRIFSNVPLAGAIVTKVDETAQLGCVISTLIRHDLKAAFFCDGQRVPDDLHYAEKKRLWLINQAIECMRASAVNVDEQTMISRFGYAGALNA